MAGRRTSQGPARDADFIILLIQRKENMPTRKAEAEWRGNLAEGEGNLRVGSGAFSGPYSFKSRFEDGQSATNPEELIGAAHAGCFTMALTAALSRNHITATRIHTEAQ